MWFYCVAHCAYHLARWFPKDDRGRIKIAIICFTMMFLIPQIYVLLLPPSSRYCDQPLLNITVACIVFTFAMIAFSFLFAMMEPVPWQLKIAFHFFGFSTLLMGLVLYASTESAVDCRGTAAELYYMCLAFGIFAILSTAFVILMLPFWLINYFWPDSVLNRRERRGVCYEPVKCCTCLWHI